MGIFKFGSPTLVTIANAALRNPDSIFGSNYVEIIGHENSDFMGVRQKLFDEWSYSLTAETRVNVGVLKELIDVRDGVSICPVFEPWEIPAIIDEICIN